jgi:HEAT repeat protein
MTRHSTSVLSALVVLAASAAGAQQVTWQDLVRTLRHPDPRMRLQAVESLGDSGYTVAAEAVAPLVVDPDDKVQAAAIDAELTFFLVEPIGGRKPLGIGGSRTRAQEAFEAGPLVRSASRAPAAVIDHLIKAIRDDHARIQFDAVHAIGVVGEAPLADEQTRALVDGLDHYNPIIRAATARVLGRLRARAASDKLMDSLADSSPVVRRWAIEALGLIREDRAVARLMKIARESSQHETGAEAVLALARIASQDARDLFRSRLTDREATVRRGAAEGLARLGDRDAIEGLRTMAQADRSAIVRLAAAFALHKLGEPQLPALMTAFGIRETGWLACQYLLEIGAPAAPAVHAALGSTPDPRRSAELLHLYGYLATRDDVPGLEPFVADKDERVSRAAANAVARLRR